MASIMKRPVSKIKSVGGESSDQIYFTLVLSPFAYVALALIANIGLQMSHF